MSVDVLPCSSLSSQPEDHSTEMCEASVSSKSSSMITKSRSQAAHAQSNQQRYDSNAAFKHTVALAVIARLQQWCRQLFWLTIICVMGCCGELNSKDRAKTIQHVRRTISQSAGYAKRSVAEIEMQLLRHLTSPQSAVFRSSRSLKKRGPSRPPSPQLFDISEEAECQCDTEC